MRSKPGGIWIAGWLLVSAFARRFQQLDRPFLVLATVIGTCVRSQPVVRVEVAALELGEERI